MVVWFSILLPLSNKEEAMMFCKNCCLSYQCVCDDIPQLNTDIVLSLLMHENEYSRETNTGKWLLKSLPQCRDYPWSRVAPNKELLERVNHGCYLSLLIYPSEDSIALDEALLLAARQQKQPNFIILDGTWQEAKKMERKSPWLDTIQRVHLTPEHLSRYQLRRNQNQGHLCTLEVATEILQKLGDHQPAKQLTSFLAYFSKVYQADKSGHVYQPD